MSDTKTVSMEELVLEAIDQMGPLKKRVYTRVYNNMSDEAKTHLTDELAVTVSEAHPELTTVFSATDFSTTTKFEVKAVDWQAIIKLILDNLPSIIALIVKLFL